jgi:hypothetical protein
MSTSTIRLHRVLRATPERIYRAFLDPDALAKWLPPNGFGVRRTPEDNQDKLSIEVLPQDGISIRANCDQLRRHSSGQCLLHPPWDRTAGDPRAVDYSMSKIEWKTDT